MYNVHSMHNYCLRGLYSSTILWRHNLLKRIQRFNAFWCLCIFVFFRFNESCTKPLGLLAEWTSSYKGRIAKGSYNMVLIVNSERNVIFRRLGSEGQLAVFCTVCCLSIHLSSCSILVSSTCWTSMFQHFLMKILPVCFILHSLLVDPLRVLFVRFLLLLYFKYFDTLDTFWGLLYFWVAISKCSDKIFDYRKLKMVYKFFNLSFSVLKPSSWIWYILKVYLVFGFRFIKNTIFSLSLVWKILYFLYFLLG